jgi:hypothetical protein
MSTFDAMDCVLILGICGYTLHAIGAYMEGSICFFFIRGSTLASRPDPTCRASI